MSRKSSFSTNDSTKIYKSPIPFNGPDFLASASRWTKSRIFSSASVNPSPVGVGGPSSPPPAPGTPAADPALLNASARNAYHAKPNVELSSNSGQVLLTYPSVAQIWSYSEEDCAFCISGSTFGVNGKIITAHFIPATASPNQQQTGTKVRRDSDSDPHMDGNAERRSRNSPYDDNGMLSANATRNLVLLQVLRKETIYLEVHQLNKKPSFVKSLVLPPASSGPGPYSIYSSSCIAVITTSGLVTLFSVPQFHPLPLSGLEICLNSEGLPLFDMSGRWLAYCPTSLPTEAVSESSTAPSSSALRTPLKLPPPGQLLDRILENLSTTTASSLKSISDAGVAGIRHYLSSSTSQHGASLADDYAKKRQANIVLVGSNKFSIDSSGRVAIATKEGSGGSGSITSGSPGRTGRVGPNVPVPSAVIASLPAALSSLFQNQANTPPVQIIDLEIQKPVCTFTPPQGISHISLSPYDAVLATVSARGETIFTFDLSFLPQQVSLSGKYVRGVTPAKVHQVEWDVDGGFGIITRDKGSVHWFERQPWNAYESTSFNSSDNISGGTSVSPSSSGVVGSTLGSTAAGAASLIKSAPLGMFTNSSKMWKLSGWNVQSMMLVPETIGSEKDPRLADEEALILDDDEEDVAEPALVSYDTYSLEGPHYSRVLMLREGQLLAVDVTTGTCSWKYDLPWHPVAENFLTREIGIEIIRDASTGSNNGSSSSLPGTGAEQQADYITTKSKIHASDEPDRRPQLIKTIEPLAFFELEPCLPYPFLHTDRHIILATYQDEEDENLIDNNTTNSEEMYDAYQESSDAIPGDDIYYPSTMFGLPIKAKELDFGRAKGQVQFGGVLIVEEGTNSNSGSEVASRSGSEGGTPLFSDVDEHVLHEMDSAVIDGVDGDSQNFLQSSGWNSSKTAELELAMQSMVIFEKHDDDEDALLIVT